MEFIEEYITQKCLNMFREEKEPPCFELLLQNDRAMKVSCHRQGSFKVFLLVQLSK